MAGGKITPLIAAGDRVLRTDVLDAITTAIDLAKAEFELKLAEIEDKLDQEIELLRAELEKSEEGAPPS